MHHGDPRYGRELLERLTGNSVVGAQASALLEGAQPTSVPAQAPKSRYPTSTDVIALEALGSHYHLALGLSDNLNVRLVIDTGASVTTLSRDSFEAIRHRGRFTELGPQVFNTAGGVSRGTMYRVDTLRLGKQVLSDVPIAVLDFDMPNGIDGLLGMNVLRHFRFQVDQDREELHLEPR